jgi:hypothetical protein
MYAMVGEVAESCDCDVMADSSEGFGIQGSGISELIPDRICFRRPVQASHQNWLVMMRRIF